MTKAFTLCLFIFGIAVNSQASDMKVLLEPGLGYKFGWPGSDHLGGTYNAAQVGLRFGLVRDEMYFAADTTAFLAKETLRYDRSIFGWSIGASIGGTMVFLPFRFYLGVYLIDRISALGSADSQIKGTFAPRFGMGIYFSESTMINLEILQHKYDEVTVTDGAKTIASGNATVNSITLTLQFPMELEAPSAPWRKK